MVDSGQLERTGEAGIGITLITLGSTYVSNGDTESIIAGLVLIALGFAIILLREIRKSSAIA